MEKQQITGYRHGDVFLRAVLAVPPAAHEDAQWNRVLAYGEVTGHAHRVSGAMSLWNAGEQRYVAVGAEGATLTHEEHGPIAVAPGAYEVVIQRQWDYLQEMARAVAD